jgi:hypothetical protein
MNRPFIKRLFLMIALIGFSAMGRAESDSSFEPNESAFCSNLPDSIVTACEICLDDCFDVFFTQKNACVGKPPMEYQQCVAMADQRFKACANGCRNVPAGPPLLAAKCSGTNSRSGEQCECGPQSTSGANIRRECVVGNCVGIYDVYDAGDKIFGCN